MEYPNGSRRSSRYQHYIEAAHKARSEAFYHFGGAVKEGVVATGRATVASVMRLFRWLDRTRRQRAARRELEAMDNHLLADLGISRQDIDNVVRHGKSAPEGMGEAQPAHPHEVRRAAKVVALRGERDLMGALIVHGPWSRYTHRPNKRNDAA